MDVKAPVASRGVHIQKLINLVSRHEPLYNPRHSQFRDKHYTSAIWKSIAEELGTTEPEVKHKWQNLRSNFMRERRKVIRSNGTARIPWVYYRKLVFLEKFLKSGDPDADESSQQLDYMLGSDSNSQNPSFMTAEVFETTPTRIGGNDSSVKPEVVYEAVSDNEESSETERSLEDSTGHTSNKGHYEQSLVTGQDPLLIENCTLLMDDPDLSFFRGLLPHIKHLGAIENLAFKSEVVQLLERRMKRSE